MLSLKLGIGPPGRASPIKLSRLGKELVTIVDEQRRGITLGAAGYLTKPIDRQRLLGILNSYRVKERASTVLIVDDDEEHRELVRATLEAQGWVVREAANGRFAIEAFASGLPDRV